MGMTMTQKILAAHAGLPSVKAGDLINANLDLVLANDITGPVSILSLSGHLLRFTSDDQRVDQPIDSDSINAPAPAIQDISDINEVNDVTIKASNDSIKPRQEIVKDEAPKEKVESQKPEIKNDVETEPVKPVEPDQVEPAIPQVSPTPVPDNPTE